LQPILINQKKKGESKNKAIQDRWGVKRTARPNYPDAGKLYWRTSRDLESSNGEGMGFLLSRGHCACKPMKTVQPSRGGSFFHQEKKKSGQKEITWCPLPFMCSKLLPGGGVERSSYDSKRNRQHLLGGGEGGSDSCRPA